jgi:D-3-phosphoglycerate dehydrogenase / 2-oxoglutarate reductase
MHVLICDGLVNEAVEMLTSAGHTVDLQKGISKEALLDKVVDAEVVVVRSATRITPEILERAGKLKLIVRGGVGLDNIDCDAAQARGVAVFNTPSATSISVAEHTLGLMLSLARHLHQSHSSVTAGEWNRKAFSGTELFGKTLGIVGFGRIGQEVAKRALAFRMNVVVFDRAVDPEIVAVLEVESSPDIDTLLGQADYVTLHLPLNTETDQLINADRVDQMKNGAFLINTARGGLLDETAVAAALTSGKLAGVAVDVYSNEPPAQGHPLVGLPQALTVPHIGGSTAEGQHRTGLEVAKIINEFTAKR